MAVCIAGMHRSGTSMVARLVNLLGVDLGPEGEQPRPAPDNVAGFWEDPRFVALSDEALAGSRTTVAGARGPGALRR